jgi:2-(1,2-epoxy-1,2-dihydrophenyl)acetyl-CoA isomerase
MAILLHEIDKPMIAAVNGAAAGAGLALVLHHDYRIASDAAKFTATYMNIGLAPDANLSYALPRAVGWPVASDLLFTARMVLAEEALQLGLVQKVVPAETLVDDALAYAQTLAARSPMAVQFTKRALRRSWQHAFEEHVEYEWMGQRWHGETGVSRYAAAEFLARRKG